MESLGVISRIAELTRWYAAMVVVPKASGAVRICGHEGSQQTSIARGTPYA